MKRLTFALTILLLSASLAAQQPAVSIRNGTADPATCKPGSTNIFYRSDTAVLKVCSAANTWTALGSGVASAANGGTGQSTYTKGDLLATPGGAVLNKLAVGADGFVLTADTASTNGVKWATGGLTTTGTTTGATSQAQTFTDGITLGSSSVPGVLNLYAPSALSPAVISVSVAVGTILLDPLLTPSGSGNALLDNNPVISSGALTVTQTGGIVGTTTNNNASAGSFGEFKTAVCPGPATTATITVTIATPAVVTWTAHPFSGTAPRFDACPVVFTTSSSLPTGITAGTNYWVVPASISGNNFSIATSVANAIAGTKVATTGSQAGTQTGTAGTVLSTGATKDITGFALSVGDWDCSGATDFQFGSTTSITNLVGSISTTSATLGGQDTGFDFETSAAIPTATADMTWRLSDVRQLLSGTTNVFSVAQGTFTASTLKAYGTIRCRRMR